LRIGGIVARKEALEVEHDEAVLGVLLGRGCGGGGGGGARGHGVGEIGGDAVAGEGLLAGAGALVEDGAIDLRGREDVGVAAPTAGVDGVGRCSRERRKLRLGQRAEVNHGSHLRPHGGRRRRRLAADEQFGVWLRKRKTTRMGKLRLCEDGQRRNEERASRSDGRGYFNVRALG
jgi:hypothetical protein